MYPRRQPRQAGLKNMATPRSIFGDGRLRSGRGPHMELWLTVLGFCGSVGNEVPLPSALIHGRRS